MSWCCGDYDGGTALGNLVDRPLSAILLSDRARSIARAMNHYRLVEPKCQACFASTHPLMTAAKVLLLSGMFKNDKRLKHWLRIDFDQRRFRFGGRCFASRNDVRRHRICIGRQLQTISIVRHDVRKIETALAICC